MPPSMSKLPPQSGKCCTIIFLSNCYSTNNKYDTYHNKIKYFHEAALDIYSICAKLLCYICEIMPIEFKNNLKLNDENIKS